MELIAPWRWTALATEVLKLERPLPDGTLRIVAQWTKKDSRAEIGMTLGGLLQGAPENLAADSC